MLPKEFLEMHQEKEKKLFKEAAIYFDTSSLLDLYFFSEDVQQDIFENIFSKIGKKLYVSDHSLFEFFKNKQTVLLKPAHTYKNLMKIGSQSKKDNDGGHLEKIERSLKNLSEKGFSDIVIQGNEFSTKTKKKTRHPYVDDELHEAFEDKIHDFKRRFNSIVSDFSEEFVELKSNIENQINTKISKIEGNILNDKLERLITEYFTPTETNYPFAKLLEIVEEGELRYRNKIPPGYEDFKVKEGIQKYGDLICWKQILEHANKHKKPAILVCDDVKPDWVAEQRPRLELIKEYLDATNQPFWMYNLSDFIYKAGTYFDSQMGEATLDEVEQLKDKNERKQFDLELKNIIQDYLEKEYLLYELKDEKKNELLYKCVNYELNDVIVYFVKATKSNYTSLLNSMYKSLSLLTEELTGTKIQNFQLVHITSNKNAAHKILNNHITRATTKKVYEDNKDKLNLKVGYINPDTNGLEFIF